MPSIQQLNAFIALLAAHDWQFEFSDDHSVWRKGNAADQALRAKAKTNEIYDRAYFGTWRVMHNWPLKGTHLSKRDYLTMLYQGLRADVSELAVA